MPATVEKVRVSFGRSFELGRRWGIAGCTANPTRGIQRPVFDNRRERFLTASEAGRLLKAAGRSRNPQLRPIVGLLLLTGARVSELLQAQWCHIEFNFGHKKFLFELFRWRSDKLGTRVMFSVR